MLKSTDNLSLVQPHLESLLKTLLSSEKHPDVLEDKRRILANLISRLPLDNLEDRTIQILIGLCRQGGAGSNRVAKALMQRLPPTAVVIKLISDDFLKSHSSRVSECFAMWILALQIGSLMRNPISNVIKFWMIQYEAKWNSLKYSFQVWRKWKYMHLN